MRPTQQFIQIRRAGGLLLAAGVIFLAGCEDDGRPPRVPVSGRVLIDGKPLDRGYVRFIPASGRASGGQIDRFGRFRLSCFGENDGAVLGLHKIAVVSYEVFSETEIGWNVPKKYAEVASSGLEQVINRPTDSVEVNLTWAGESPVFEVQPSDEEPRYQKKSPLFYGE
jgi:hypothetical protein